MSGELEEKLVRIGFSNYESKVYSAIVSLCETKMKTLSEVSGVPYQKTYEVVSRLEKKGFVKVINSRPKRIRLVDPNLSFENYKESVINQVDEIKSEIRNAVKIKRGENPGVIQGRRQVMNFIKTRISESKTIKGVYRGIPGWLVKALERFQGDLTLVVDQGDVKRVKNLRGDIRVSDTIGAKYLIFDDEVSVIFTDESYLTVESCPGCIVHSIEHFKFSFNSSRFIYVPSEPEVVQ
ncbi:TrmB family transcriptional regulator [Metallosphaera tengchongensis]|uniref:TrmB family transcriptional regulator n=1 Tax=Metallosphaera tengchongensis TaxID=1532350 RepID=A0A6N0NV16_9CREN|nr:TrmB family transcriptional regulator [Metallosphaera tengchongensis]QKR00646.1 TrmB family transcriptional regulator [Metallosphaera tengchongensis]